MSEDIFIGVKGVPNVYARNGKSYYEMPDGTTTTTSAFTQEEGKQEWSPLHKHE